MVAGVALDVKNDRLRFYPRLYIFRREKIVVFEKNVFFRPIISERQTLCVGLPHKPKTQIFQIAKKRGRRLLVKVARQQDVFAAADFLRYAPVDGSKLRKAKRYEFFIGLPRPLRAF